MEHQDLDSLSDAELQALIAQLSNPPPTPDVPVEAYHYNVPLPPLPPPPPSTSPMAHTPPPQPSPTSAHSAGAFPPSHPYLTTLYTPSHTVALMQLQRREAEAEEEASHTESALMYGLSVTF